MKGIHKEWMSYAFQLDKYASENKRTLMEIGIKLATTANFGDGHANENLFYGQIQFNDALAVEGDVVGAFSFTIQNLVKTLDSKPMQALLSRFTKENISAAISDYVSALRDLHGQPRKESLLFGKYGKDHYTCIGEGLMEAWLWHLNDLAELPSYEATHELSRASALEEPTGNSCRGQKVRERTIRTPCGSQCERCFTSSCQEWKKFPMTLASTSWEERTQKWVLNLVLKRMDNSSSNPFTELKLRRFWDISLEIPSFRGQRRRNRVRHHISQ